MKKFVLEMLPFMALFAMLVFASCSAKPKVEKQEKEWMELQKTINTLHQEKGLKVAYFADACYWCSEGIWESLEGVVNVESGFVGGTYPTRPTYANHGDFAEGNRIVYDPKVISYAQLVDAYFDGHSFGKSPDKGPSYRAMAFFDGEVEQHIIEKRWNEAKIEHHFQQTVGTINQVNWFIGPEDHQDYIQRLEAGQHVPNKRYGLGESIPRRDRALKEISAPKKRKLTKFQKQILRSGHTESPFTSPLNREKRSGVYVSAETGDTLFVSKAKFKSGTGWPSFDDATDKVSIGRGEQGGHEVIEKSTGGHLGHLFQGEGFTEKNKRYCINGSILDFKPIKE